MYKLDLSFLALHEASKSKKVNLYIIQSHFTINLSLNNQHTVEVFFVGMLALIGEVFVCLFLISLLLRSTSLYLTSSCQWEMLWMCFNLYHNYG